MQLQPQIRHIAFHTMQADLHCWGSSRVMDDSWLHGSQGILSPRYVGSTCNKQQCRLSSEQRRCRHDPSSAHWIHRYFTQMDKKSKWWMPRLGINRGLAPPYPIYFEGSLQCLRVHLCWNFYHCTALPGLLSTTYSGDRIIRYNHRLHKTATNQIGSESNFKTVLPGDVWDQVDANSFTGLLNCWLSVD